MVNNLFFDLIFLALLRMNYTKEIFSKCLLVLAGGYDILNEENLLYYQHLKELVEKEKLQDSVIFVLSPGLFLKIFLNQF